MSSCKRCKTLYRLSYSARFLRPRRGSARDGRRRTRGAREGDLSDPPVARESRLCAAAPIAKTPPLGPIGDFIGPYSVDRRGRPANDGGGGAPRSHEGRRFDAPAEPPTRRPLALYRPPASETRSAKRNESRTSTSRADEIRRIDNSTTLMPPKILRAPGLFSDLPERFGYIVLEIRLSSRSGSRYRAVCRALKGGASAGDGRVGSSSSRRRGAPPTRSTSL